MGFSMPPVPNSPTSLDILLFDHIHYMGDFVFHQIYTSYILGWTLDEILLEIFF